MAIGDPERATQNRMIAQLCGDTSGQTGGLGWRYLGDWQKREGNANIEPTLLRPWLLARGHDPDVATRAITELGACVDELQAILDEIEAENGE